jgi:phenylpropionate dioxygenase-like ring-hydroxylating dioxygenase large terminal subunit
MIPNYWYAVLESRHLKTKPVAIKRLGQSFVLWRDHDGKAVCMEDRCAHRGAALSLGRILDGEIACRYHGFRYNSEGRCTRVPCAGRDAKIPPALKVPTYPVTEKYGIVFLWWGEEPKEWPEPPWIDELPQDPRKCKTHSEIWPFNYVRSIENQLDTHHWAFVHGAIMLVPGERLEDASLDVNGDLICYAGTLRRPHVPPGKQGWDFGVKVRLPNATVIRVTPRFNSITYFTPIDEFSSFVLLRINQNYARVPLMRQLFDTYCIKFMFLMTNYRQDFPVLHSLRPRTGGLGAHRLVKADQGIAAYIRLRETRIREALYGADKTGESLPRKDDNEPIRFNWRTRADAPNDAPFRLDARRELGLPTPVNGGATDFPRLPMLPPKDRRAHIGAERGWRRAVAWAKVQMVFPMVFPLWCIHKVIDRIDRA